MEITNTVKYLGVNDHTIDLFEGQYKVPNGMAYNSYLILDEKIAVLDTVDVNFTEEWMQNLKTLLGSRQPDYLIVHHMEPDHSAGITVFAQTYPDAVIVASAPAFTMMKQFSGTDFAHRRTVIKEGDTLTLGEHSLTFLSAPMVHWPEVMVSYDSYEKILFSADAFGKFGALDVEEDWTDEARRYYIGIVGKYGMQVQNLLKKAAAVTIQTICPLHGPILTEHLDSYLHLYDIWSSYAVETEGVFIAYTSIYGHTKEAALLLAKKLREAGCPNVETADLAREDMAKCVGDAFRYGKLALAAPTYNADIFPFMKEFLQHLTERNFQNRTVAFIENGSWALTAAKTMKSMLEACKNLTFAENVVHIKSALSEESLTQLDALAAELCMDQPSHS